jgi:hypothetical protein
MLTAEPPDGTPGRRRRTGRCHRRISHRHTGRQPSSIRVAGCNCRRRPPGSPPHQQPAQDRRGRGLQPLPKPHCPPTPHRQTSCQPSVSGTAGCNRSCRRYQQRRSWGTEPFLLQHHRGFLHARAPFFTFLPTSRGQEAGGRVLCGPPPKESLGAPDQMTVSQHPSPLFPPPSSLFCNLCIKALYPRRKYN